jgi:hypothetical protein
LKSEDEGTDDVNREEQEGKEKQRVRKLQEWESKRRRGRSKGY